jgi:biopolymer transport protein ExbD
MKMADVSVRAQRWAREKDPDVSPLIDMVFILLIFFIVTTVFVDEAGFEVEVPGPPRPDIPAALSETVKLSIGPNGIIRHGGEAVELHALPGFIRAHPEAPVLVEVHKEALSGWMVQALDAVRLGGAEKISVTRQR